VSKPVVTIWPAINGWVVRKEDRSDPLWQSFYESHVFSTIPALLAGLPTILDPEEKPDRVFMDLKDQSISPPAGVQAGTSSVVTGGLPCAEPKPPI
jgi:hypothetical protein